MLFAQHLDSLLSLVDLAFSAEHSSVLSRIGVMAMIGMAVLTVMSLPIFSLPGLGMLAAGLVLHRIWKEIDRMQAEAEALDREHHLQIEMADRLMLTPPSIRS